MFFCFLYYMFRPSAASTTAKAKKTNSDRGQIVSTSQTVIKHNLGAAFGSIIVNQLQIVAVLLSQINWSPELPRWMVNALLFLSKIFTIDLAGFLTSPDCAVDLEPLDKWLIGVSMPIGLGFIFFMWFLVARCYFKITKTYDEQVVHTILQSSVNVLMIGLYTTVVRNCCQILGCSTESVPKLNMDPTIDCSDENTIMMQNIGITIFVLWCVVPFLVLSIQLIRYKCTGTLEKHVEESASFRIMYGWAITKYRSDSNVAFLWEVFNAVVKVGMVASSELMYEKNSRIAQSILIGVSLILHIMVMPYQTTAGNPTWLAIVFGVVDLGEIYFFGSCVVYFYV